MAIEEGNTNKEISDDEFRILYLKLLNDIKNSDSLSTDDGAKYELEILRILRNSDLGKRFQSIVKSGFDQMAQDADKMVPRSYDQDNPPPSARLPFEPPREPRDPFRESKELVYVKEGKAYISKDDLLQIIKEELLTTLSFNKD